MGQYSRYGFVVVSVKTKGAHHDQDHQNSILPSGTSTCRRPHPCDSGRPGRPRGRGSRRNLRPRRSGDGGNYSRQYASTASAHGSLRAAARRSRVRLPRRERPVCQHSPGRLFTGSARCLCTSAPSPATALAPSATASAAALAPSATASAAALASPAGTAPSHAACAPAPRPAKTVNESAQRQVKRSNPAGFDLFVVGKRRAMGASHPSYFRLRGSSPSSTTPGASWLSAKEKESFFVGSASTLM